MLVVSAEMKACRSFHPRGAWTCRDGLQIRMCAGVV